MNALRKTGRWLKAGVWYAAKARATLAVGMLLALGYLLFSVGFVVPWLGDWGMRLGHDALGIAGIVVYFVLTATLVVWIGAKMRQWWQRRGVKAPPAPPSLAQKLVGDFLVVLVVYGALAVWFYWHFLRPLVARLDAFA
jgi:hypothetical protein